MNFQPFPEIKTERLLLRKIEASDSDVILFLRSDAIVTKFIERPENRKTRDIDDARKFINELHQNIKENKSITWGITLKHDSKLIGTICLWNFSENKETAEVGYDLDSAYHKKGIMHEALNAILDYGFEDLKLDKIEAFTHRWNSASKSLLEKNAFLLIEDRRDENNEHNIIFELANTSYHHFKIHSRD